MNHEAVFVDTWGWMALGHRQEPRHAEVKRIYRELRSNGIPIYTSDYVLDELITLLFRREVFEEAVRFVEGILGSAVLGQLRIERVPYPIFNYAALVPWTFFANGPSQSSTSLVASANLIKKVYFPRLVVPISSVISGAVDFVLAFVTIPHRRPASALQDGPRIADRGSGGTFPPPIVRRPRPVVRRLQRDRLALKNEYINRTKAG
ncbi:MAG: hypothetical protein FJ014_09830 [Chloroflexi bacterium]|nr:hypothetical protein [Chloroflexota bacterium]